MEAVSIAQSDTLYSSSSSSSTLLSLFAFGFLSYTTWRKISFGFDWHVYLERHDTGQEEEYIGTRRENRGYVFADKGLEYS